MAGKKDFTGGLSSLLGESTPAKLQETISPAKSANKSTEISKTSQIGTKANETRATFIVNEGALEKLKAIAYWERLQIKDVVASALESYLNTYEKASGPIKPIPQK